MIFETLTSKIKSGEKLLALLIDPGKYPDNNIMKVITAMESATPDLILVGGSLMGANMDPIIDSLRENLDLPILIFPGSLLQISPKADAILLLSLISGRNPDLLIGNHVAAAPYIKESGLEAISTGYILIDGGKPTSVEYMSQTKPIPADKAEIAVATAMAGEMLGLKMIYLEGGSGASQPISEEIIAKVKENTTVPIMVGGGLNSPTKVKNACDAGADIIVVGNAFEQDLSLLKLFHHIVKQETQFL